MSKKIVPEILWFVSMLFLIFEKAIAKNCARYFQIRKYAFLIFEKAMSNKIAPQILTFVSILFLIFETAISKITFPGYFRFINMISLIFEKAMRKKLCQVFSDSEVCLFNIWKSDKLKNCDSNFKIRKYAFSNIKKRILTNVKVCGAIFLLIAF